MDPDGADTGQAEPEGTAPHERGALEGAGDPDDVDVEPGGDEVGPGDPRRFNQWMRRSTTGVLMTGIAIGLQEALELPRKQPAFVIKATGEPDDPDRPIDLLFDPEHPERTVARIRPWLMEGGGGNEGDDDEGSGPPDR